ncbi:hypothetical protein REPUB_Repub03eG0254300 [Reevesia pubescens]
MWFNKVGGGGGFMVGNGGGSISIIDSIFAYTKSVLSGGGSAPLPEASEEDWVNMVNAFQNGSLSSHLGIPIVYGIDAIHGHKNV